MATSIPRTIDYVEIPSRDVAISRAFFTQLVGWTFTDYGPEYTSFEDSRITGGFYKSDKISRFEAGGALVVIYTETLEQANADVILLGASITRDIFSFPGGRRFQFTEPGGSEFSICSDK